MPHPPIRDPYKLVDTMLGRYRVLEAVGGGGMGIVYHAQHEITKADVAIKVLRPENSDPKNLRRFLDEAEHTARLNHAAIVKIFSADLINNDAFLVMEWLDGRTLDTELKERGRLPLAQVVALMEQVCAGVAYAHRRGIIHRDLKPANLMLVTDEQGEETVRILDFGIAKALNATHSYNTQSIGTIYYASPEQLRAGAKIDHRADIYSLGAILFQLLTGRPPFDADSALAVMDMHRGAPPPSLRQFNLDITPALEEVVLRALAKQPEERQQTATELAQALRLAAHIQNSTVVVCAQDMKTQAALAGAAVYVNGKYAGLTNEHGNLFLEQLPPRQYLLEVACQRYVHWHRSVTLEPSEELEVAAKLNRAAVGELLLVCNAPGATVEVDDVKKGETNETGRVHLEALAAGPHQVRVSHPDYAPAETTVQIGVWQQALHELSLGPPPPNALLAGWQRFTDSLRKKRAHRSPTELQTASLAALPLATLPPPPKLLPEGQVRRPCPRCGAALSTNLKFCVQCGVSLPAPRAQNKPVAAPAPELIIERSCERCGEALPLTATTCPGCEQRRTDAGLQRKPLWRLVLNAALLALLVVGLAWLAWTRRVLFSPPELPKVKLMIEPPDSKVLVQGHPRQVTSLGQVNLSDLADGTYSVVVSKPCYVTQEVPITLPQQAQPKITLDALKAPEGMVCIPGGKFKMGRDSGPEEEGPAHEVTVEPYFIDITEITVEQYQQFLAANPAFAPPRDWKGKRQLPLERAALPMTGVTWGEADTFAKWAGKRLPTEEEWEFTARSGQDWLYPWGNTLPNSSQANYNDEAGMIKPAADFVASPWGVKNLIGNVWEWTRTDCQAYPQASLSAKFCPDGYGMLKIIRGGSYREDDITATTRRAFPATWDDWKLNRSDADYSKTGFRCVQSLR